VREDHPNEPLGEYGRSKRAGERHALAQAGSIPVTVVRPPVVYGPRDTGVLAFFQIAARGFRPVFSNEKYYSIIHVSDLVRGTLLAGESERAVGRIYHIANRTAPSFSELFRLISAEVGRTTRPLPLPTGLLPLVAASVDALSAALGLDLRPLRDKVKDIAPDYWIADTTRAVADLGFRARIPLAEGFAETARGYRRLGWIPRMDTAV